MGKTVCLSSKKAFTLHRNANIILFMGEEKKTNRQVWEENIRRKYADRDFSDEDDLYAVSMEGYDKLKDERKRSDEDNRRMYELLSANPEVKDFIASVVAGESIGKALSHLADILPLEEGSDEYKAYMEGIEERKRRASEAEEAEQQFDSNLAASQENMKKFAEKNGLTEDETGTFLDWVMNEITEKFLAGNIDETTLEKFYRAYNYDKDMAAAEEAGRIKGRNEQIRARQERQDGGDGLPPILATAGDHDMKQETRQDATSRTLDTLSRRGEARRKLLG